MKHSIALRLAFVASLVPALGTAAAPKASPSPTGPLGIGKLAYDQNGVIKVLDMESGKTESYDLPERLEMPYWGRDGKRFLYNSDFGVSLLDISAQTFTALTSASQKAVDPAWSADASQIVFEMREKDTGLYLFTMADKKSVRIPLPMAGSQPDWHPTENRILFTGTTDGVPQLYTLSLDCLKDASCEKAAVQLTKDGKSNSAGAWSPDGTRIVFERDEGKGPGITVMKADGTSLKRLSPPKASDHHPCWGGQDQIAFERDPVKPATTNTLMIMSAEGTGAKVVVKGEKDKDGKEKEAGHNPNWWTPAKP